MKKQGWDVSVITPAPHYPQNTIYKGYGERIFDKRMEDDIEVIRVKPIIVNRSSLLKRFLSELYLSINMSFVACGIKSSYLFITIPYIPLSFVGSILNKFKSSKLIIEIRDLIWKYGSATNNKTYGLEKILEKLILYISKRSDYLITTTQGQLDYFVINNSSPRKSMVVPNGIDESLINKLKTIQSENVHNASDRLKVLYAGAIGFPQGLDLFVSLALKFPKIDFILAGDGVEKEVLERRVARENIENIEFTGYLSQDKLLKKYMEADILYASLIDDPVFELTQPSKIWEYMCASKPILYSGNGEANNIIKEANCGIAVTANNLNELERALIKMLGNSSLRQIMGNKGRQFVMNNYKREKILRRFEAFLSNELK